MMWVFVVMVCWELYFRLHVKCETSSTTLTRYFIGSDARKAIFGSYSYDLIKQVFNPPEKCEDKHQLVNSSYILSTAVGSVESTTQGHESHPDPTDSLLLKKSGKRKIVKLNTVPYKWWEKSAKIHNT